MSTHSFFGFRARKVLADLNRMQFLTELLEVAQTQCDATTEQKLRQLKQQLLFSLNSNYEIRDQRFSVTRVVDDQIFTYIQLAKSQNRPAVTLEKALI
jgi:hypothetical protein